MLSADCSKDFDEFVARSDSFRDDCTKRDRDHGGAWHVGEGSLFERGGNQESDLFVRPSSFEAKVTPDG